MFNRFRRQLLNGMFPGHLIVDQVCPSWGVITVTRIIEGRPVSYNRSPADAVTFTRRGFLSLSLGSGCFLRPTSPSLGNGNRATLPTHRFRVRRSYDLLNCEFTFVNFALRGHDLLALGQGQSLVIVRFPPQNLAEAIFDKPPANKARSEIEPLSLPKDGESNNSPLPPIRSFLSGPSWIVFAAPDGLRLPYRADSRSGRRSVVDRWLRAMAEWKDPHSAQRRRSIEER